MKYHFYMPLVILILIALKGFGKYAFSEIVIFLPVFVFLCLPYLIIVGIGRLIKSKEGSIHTILIGVHSALVITYMLVSADGSNSAAGGWIFYYPLSILFVLIISIFVKRENESKIKRRA